MLAGLMMQIARQIGLHRPSHVQDFTKLNIELREEELRDRVKTWAACNVIAQRLVLLERDKITERGSATVDPGHISPFWDVVKRNEELLCFL